MLNVITLSQHEKANLTLPLGSGLPGGIQWGVDELWFSHPSCNWVHVRLLGVHAHANAR
jgi:hypothetical protein